MIKILGNYIKQFFKKPENLIYVAFVSVFLHFAVTVLVVFAFGFVILFNKEKRKMAFSYKGRVSFLLFTIYTIIIAAFNGNYIGMLCSVFFFFVIVISYYARHILTSEILENGLNLCCIMSLIITVCAVIDKCFNLDVSGYRCTLWFFNTNYLSTIMATVIIICGHKVVNVKTKSFFYYVTAFCCALTMYLCGSIFAFIEIFVGISVLLLLNRKHFMLSLFLFTVCICIVILYCEPEIFPRLMNSNITTDNRILIWDASMNFIKESPLFGRGFLSYYLLSNGVEGLLSSTHAHNLALEPILSFGLIGSLILLCFIWSYYKKAAQCKELLRKNKTTILILSISAAVLIHATTDMTMLWVQTGLLYALILGGLGIDERALEKRALACVKNSEKYNSVTSKEE